MERFVQHETPESIDEQVANGTRRADNDPRLVPLRFAVTLVYVRTFSDSVDQRCVASLLDTLLPVPATLLATLPERVIDSGSGELFVQLGSVFVVRGTEPSVVDESESSSSASLVHDSTTIACLEELATASVSGLAVLLEGGAAARKTALVRELARLARRKLVVFSLSHDTEVSELIGQWLPREIATTTSHEIDDGFPYAKLHRFYDAVLRILLVQVTHCVALLVRTTFVARIAHADDCFRSLAFTLPSTASSPCKKKCSFACFCFHNCLYFDCTQLDTKSRAICCNR